VFCLAALLLLCIMPRKSFANPENEAKKLFAQGSSLYAAGNYEEASRAFKRSYEIDKAPNTLYTWAVTERRLGRCSKAKVLYRIFLADGASARRKKKINEAIKTCKPAAETKEDRHQEEHKEETVAGTQSAAVKSPHRSDGSSSQTPPAKPLAKLSVRHRSELHRGGDKKADGLERTPWYRDWVALGLLSGGVVGVVVGGISYQLALSSESDAQKPGVTYDQFVSLKDDASSTRTTALIAGSTGAFLLGGAITYIFLRNDGGRPERALSLQVGANGGSFVLGGRF